MKVNIKSLSVQMPVKQKGVEFAVYDNNDNFRGDCYVTSKGIVWCKGKTQKKNGVVVDWNEFIEWMESE